MELLDFPIFRSCNTYLKHLRSKQSRNVHKFKRKYSLTVITGTDIISVVA